MISDLLLFVVIGFAAQIVDGAIGMAKTCVAHLFCELFTRLKATGIERDNRVPMPLIQAEVGDASACLQSM